MKCCAFSFAITAALPLMPASALAQDTPAAPAASPWVGSATLASDYLFRGLTQSNAKILSEWAANYSSAARDLLDR